MARDMSILSLRELREMLKALTFDQNGDAIGAEKVVIKNQVEKRSEARVAVDEAMKVGRRLEELRKEKEEKLIDEAVEKPETKMQEKIEDETESQFVLLSRLSETKISPSLSPKEVATQKKVEKEPAIEQPPKLLPFSRKEKLEEVCGDNPREKIKTANFRKEEAEPSAPRDT